MNITANIVLYDVRFALLATSSSFKVCELEFGGLISSVFPSRTEWYVMKLCVILGGIGKESTISTAVNHFPTPSSHHARVQGA